MTTNRLALPVGPSAARVFFGYRTANLRARESDDDETRASKRTRFFHELGHTFMPGTPLMQAPLGLSAYLPAVIDPPVGSQLPDEVALIVYASLEVYEGSRETSLSRRMYTRSHSAAFDMERSAAEFPGTPDMPRARTTSDGEALFWYLFEGAIDWQDGTTRVFLVTPEEASPQFPKSLLEVSRAAAAELRSRGADQLVVGASSSFAALWLHSAVPLAADAGELGLLPVGSGAFRDLTARAAWVRGDTDRGVSIDGAVAFTFRFSRDLRFFVPTS